jgi:hypothetical protein
MKTNILDNVEISDKSIKLAGELIHATRSLRIDNKKSRKMDDELLFPLRSGLLNKFIALNLAPYLILMESLFILFLNESFLALFHPILKFIA